MSRLLVLTIMACVAASPALARFQDDDAKDGGWRPQFVAGAKPEDFKAAFPKAAWDQKISGEATLACVADAKGALQACKVHKEEPAGQGFGEAALTLVAKERIKTRDESGASTAGRPLKTHFQFLAPGDANPDWVRKPTAQELAGVFPSAAMEAQKDGRAWIKCKVTVEGFLEACKVVGEDPEGLGFGPAALQLAAQFRMSPKIRGGKPVAADVTVPVNWKGLVNSGPFVKAGAPLIMDPPWGSAPTTAQVRAAWPAAAGDAPVGSATLRCGFDKEGRPRLCDIVSEQPQGKGFGKAARTLAKEFKMNYGPDMVKKLDEIKVDIPFRFRNPAQPDGRKLTNPRWVRTLTPEGMASIFPRTALDKGVHEGLGVATCLVDATGALVDCQATRETPAGLDFAAAAISAASAMRMNPWTTEGDPVEGQRIALPIRFQWNEADKAASEGSAPAAAPGPTSTKP